MSPEEGRKLVAGGIRFAQENHFRLPPEWQKLAAAIGVTQWNDADLSQFRKEGKLWFVGEVDDLASAYLGEVNEFPVAKMFTSLLASRADKRWIGR